MVLVDTSVWIGLYRKQHRPIGELVWALAAKNVAAICGQILVEFLGGFRNPSEQKRFKASLAAFPFLETSYEAYELAAQLLWAYPSLGSGDAIIAATALAQHCPLLTVDKDFKKLTDKGLVLL